MGTNQTTMVSLPTQKEIQKDAYEWKRKVINPNMSEELLIHLCKNAVDYELWKELSYLSHLPLEGQAALFEGLLTTRVKSNTSLSANALTYFTTFSSFQVEAIKINTEVILSLDSTRLFNIVSNFGMSTRVPAESINVLWDILLLLPQPQRDKMLNVLPNKKLSIDRLVSAITDRTYNLQKLAMKRKREVMEYCSELSGTDVSALPESWIPNMLGWNWNWT
jgi:hypothetical protein